MIKLSAGGAQPLPQRGSCRKGSSHRSDVAPTPTEIRSKTAEFVEPAYAAKSKVKNQSTAFRLTCFSPRKPFDCSEMSTSSLYSINRVYWLHGKCCERCQALVDNGNDVIRAKLQLYTFEHDSTYAVENTTSPDSFFFQGALVTGLFIVVAGYAHTPTLVLLCMCIAGTFAGSVYAGFHVNMLDIAPRNASVVMGVVNTVGSFAGFLSPMLVGLITHDKVRFYMKHHS